ncbi:MAG: nucleotidyl transferase AbiEii/AbiGii toxin family protein [Chitinophagales bacterium]|nr:nucleotidyl transferase AbiEii/AbiGii toxin family protein [Bacteroidota bacterium]
MIHKNTITLEWVEKVSKTNRNADKILVEKVIRALLLLEGLSKSGLEFVFKGGTALMLLLNSAKRLSIDIDIILSDPPKDLDQLLQQVAEMQGFNKMELQHRATASDIEKAHYKFFYTPVHKMHAGDDYVLLDILFEANHYTKISPVPLQSQFIINEGDPAQINMPSLEDLLGDKLTAFAPNTTGIPYVRNDNSMTMEINKQLYDIGNLVDVVTDVEVIKTTYLNIVKTEIAYRKLEGTTAADVLEDTYQTALCIALRGTDGRGDFEALLKGIESVRGFIFSENFHLDRAITFAAKAAYVSQLIAASAAEIEKFTDPKQVAEAVIQQPHNTKLNKLKKSNPEAFFYWWKATQLRNE